MAIKVIGLDIAKNVFQVHGVDEAGRVVLRRKLRRCDVLKLFTSIEPALVGIEACHTGHYWAREIIALGHEVRLMPPQFVKPYVKRGRRRRSPVPRLSAFVFRHLKGNIAFGAAIAAIF